MLSSKNDTIYRYMKILAEKWLVEKIPKKDYYLLTDEWKNYDYIHKWEYGYTEKIPTPDGKKSDSEKFPTYTITDIWNNNIKDYITNEGLTFLSDAVKEKFIAYLVNRIVLWEKSISVDTVKTAHSSLHRHWKTEEDQLEIILNSVQSSWKWLFPLKKKNGMQQKTVWMYEDKQYEANNTLSTMDDL